MNIYIYIYIYSDIEFCAELFDENSGGNIGETWRDRAMWMSNKSAGMLDEQQEWRCG
jgi:hypothetical protein